MRRSAGSPGKDAGKATAVAATAGVVVTVRTSAASSSSHVRTGTATTIRPCSASHASSNQVMDATAISLLKENRLPIVVFNINQPGAIGRVLRGERVGTLVR